MYVLFNQYYEVSNAWSAHVAWYRVADEKLAIVTYNQYHVECIMSVPLGRFAGRDLYAVVVQRGSEVTSFCTMPQPGTAVAVVLRVSA